MVILESRKLIDGPRRFFGSKNGAKPAPASQSTLSFAPKSSKKTTPPKADEDDDAEAEVAEAEVKNLKIKSPKTKMPKKKVEEGVDMDKSDNEIATKKRSRSPPQKEEADLLGISQSYISRLEKRIMKRLRKEMMIA